MLLQRPTRQITSANKYELDQPMMRKMMALTLFAACTGCAVNSPLPKGPSAYSTIAPEGVAVRPASYLIGPLDTVNVSVFQHPELTVEEATVDPAGRLPLPLLGSVSAAGKSPDQLESELEIKFATYIIDPNVTVSVNSISQRIIVEGAVNQPGVFDIRGNASLLEALAMAESPTNVADLDEIFVFREVGGQVQGARFDLQRIRAGIDADPAIIAGDRIVVGINEVASAYQEYFAAPIFNIFRIF